MKPRHQRVRKRLILRPCGACGGIRRSFSAVAVACVWGEQCAPPTDARGEPIAGRPEHGGRIALSVRDAAGASALAMVSDGRAEGEDEKCTHDQTPAEAPPKPTNLPRDLGAGR
eukprot:6635432-Prymnesium_polylepis.3